MKKISFILMAAAFLGIIIPTSCKKDITCPGCGSTLGTPIANAGKDQVLDWPDDFIILDGSASNDPDGIVNTWYWRKISGPSGFFIANPASMKAEVSDLMEGVYLFELKVTDDDGFYSMDTVSVLVQNTASCDISNRPEVNAQLIPFATLSEARSMISAASAGNKILFAGGEPGHGNNSGSTRVDIYDLISQSWSTAELSVPRWNISAVTCEDKVFFAGGHAVSQVSWQDFAKVDVFDANLNDWSKLELSERKMDLAVTVNRNKVYFAGGVSGVASLPPSGISNKIEIYNVGTNTWETAHLSSPRAGMSAVTMADKIYFAGGNTRLMAFANTCTPVERIDIYNNRSQTWGLGALIAPQAFGASIATSSMILWAGGVDFDCNNNYVLSRKVQIMRGNSAEQFACLFQPNANMKAVSANNKVIFFTGEGPEKNKFDIYDLASKTWSIGLLPANIEGASIISVSNTIYVAGGYVDGALSNKVYKLEF